MEQIKKFYKHELTGRIIDDKYYSERLSNLVKPYFKHIENADTEEEQKESKPIELTPEEYENFI